MTPEKVIVVRGVMPDIAELNRFLVVLHASELYEHRAKTSKLEPDSNEWNVTLNIRGGAENLVKSSFDERGPLHQWAERFQIMPPT